MSRSLWTVLGAVVLVAATGCASKPQLPVALDAASLATNAPRIGVAMTKLPKAEVHLPGADCLLCIMAASAGNLTLSKHTDTLGLEDLPQLKTVIAERLRKRGATPVVLPDALDVAALPDSSATVENAPKKNFASLAAKHGIDKLLVVDIQTVGFVRRYASYIPAGDPRGTLRATGYIVNLKTNTYEWFANVDVEKSAEGPWDEPPKFPGLTNAFYQSLELGKDGLLKPLSQ
jgi:hypothetical protein